MESRRVNPVSSRFIAYKPQAKPPLRTRRPKPRISEDSQSTTDPTSKTTSSATNRLLRAYEKHCSSLSPWNQTDPLTSLTKEWLKNPNASLPEAADARVYMHMHRCNQYDAELEDFKLLSLVRSLKRGTEIEELEDPGDYNTIKDRVRQRVADLSGVLLSLSIIDNAGGSYERTRTFSAYWKAQQLDREYILSTPRPSRMVRDRRKTDADDSDDCRIIRISTGCAPARKRPESSTGHGPRPTAQDNPGDSSSVKRKQDFEQIDLELDSAKRLKSNANETANHAISNPTSDELSLPIRENNVDAEAVFSEAAESMKEFLKSPPFDRVIDVTVPVTAEQVIVHQQQQSTPPVTPRISDDTPPNIELTSKYSLDSSRINCRTEYQVNFHTPEQEWNPNKSVSANKIHGLSLSAFFELVSHQTGVQCLDCLTLNITFFGIDMWIVNRSDSEDTWEEMKENIDRRYQFARLKKRDTKCFDVWVEIGDTRGGET